MSLGINLLMYLTEIASNSLGKFLQNFKHTIDIKDYPSGTALMLGKEYSWKKKEFLIKKVLNKKQFLTEKNKFNSLRKGEIIGEHEVKFSIKGYYWSHEAFDRALY